MPPKKKVKVEVSAEDGEAEGGSKDQGAGEGAMETAAAPSQQQTVVGGPEAPKLELGSNAILFEYAPGKPLPTPETGKLLRVEIESKFLTTDNEGVKQRKIWGVDPYADNSDLVAVAMHSNVFTPTADTPKFAFLVLAVRVLPKLPSHLSSLRNGMKTRAVSGLEHSGLSIRVEGSAFCKTVDDKGKLTSVLLRPTRQERVSVKGNSALGEARAVFNLSNEPAFKYSLAIVADRAPDAKVMHTYMYTQTRNLHTYVDVHACETRACQRVWVCKSEDAYVYLHIYTYCMRV
jgi:hypothetical protein